ncbi:uncharacterized protein LACBIDRAFT_318809 [Laccaria bicolor S238N-H82]|uniref:Predicted protein n=1 Tax=Laccaria bicolor (strain S238N-H82 / ATCC MYA-4686) TaxID=486041 RepID=B0D752_LACBS|nr:uncharacterized protein LACBIDRAFT_318809 [Laccaria bicolor S238N-H82]EDR09336.1 predicted protein [Laccaria bicolor S238N-H82]|eukprot:XP_001879685.1 predicted protein [Laccaria bicolor S238N-H82]
MIPAAEILNFCSEVLSYCDIFFQLCLTVSYLRDLRSIDSDILRFFTILGLILWTCQGHVTCPDIGGRFTSHLSI